MLDKDDYPEGYRRSISDSARNDLELLRIMLNSDYVELWAEMKKKKYDRLRKLKFDHDAALRLVD